MKYFITQHTTASDRNLFFFIFFNYLIPKNQSFKRKQVLVLIYSLGQRTSPDLFSFQKAVLCEILRKSFQKKFNYFRRVLGTRICALVMVLGSLCCRDGYLNRSLFLSKFSNEYKENIFVNTVVVSCQMKHQWALSFVH